MKSVYVFDVEDADADNWSAEAAVVATKPAEASRRIRAAGLHERQIRNDARPVRVVSVSEVPEIESSSSGILRRRLDDSGWTAWTSLPVDGSPNWRRSGDAVVKTRGSGHRWEGTPD